VAQAGLIVSGQGTNTVLVRWLTPGPHLIRFIETSSIGCVGNPVSRNIQVLGGPAVPAGPPATLCNGATQQLGGSPLPNVTYQWFPGTGLSSSTVSNPTVTLFNTSSSPITVQYYVAATSLITGCRTIDSVLLTVGPTPIAFAGNQISAH
jgi:hypothetical protein